MHASGAMVQQCLLGTVMSLPRCCPNTQRSHWGHLGHSVRLQNSRNEDVEGSWSRRAHLPWAPSASSLSSGCPTRNQVAAHHPTHSGHCPKTLRLRSLWHHAPCPLVCSPCGWSSDVHLHIRHSTRCNERAREARTTSHESGSSCLHHQALRAPYGVRHNSLLRGHAGMTNAGYRLLGVGLGTITSACGTYHSVTSRHASARGALCLFLETIEPIEGRCV